MFVQATLPPGSTLEQTEEVLGEVRDYLLALLLRYQELFCGEQQVLFKMKEVVSQMEDPLPDTGMALPEWCQSAESCERPDPILMSPTVE